MSYFAEIKDNEVIRVIVADNKEWCEKNLGGIWVETFIDKPNHNYAGIGYSYIKDKNNFCESQPHKLWILDDTCLWQPPKERPLNKLVKWDDTINDWIEIETK